MDGLCTLRDVLFANPKINANRPAVFIDSHWVTFGQLQEGVSAVASALHRDGIRFGDRVALLLENSLEYIVSFFAVTGIGAIAVPLNSRLHPSEHAKLLRDAETKLLVAAAAFEKSIAEVHSQLPELPRIVIVGVGGAGQESFSAWSGNPGVMPVGDMLDPSTVASIVYTSGTTSRPKGVVLTHGNYLADISNVAAAARLDSTSINLQLSPLYHAAGIHSLAHLAVGGGTILNRHFDVEQAFDLIERERVTYFFSVPTALYQMMDHPRVKSVDLTALRTISYGAAAMTPARMREATALFGPILIHAYGLTETTSHASVLTAAEHAVAFGSVGRGIGQSEIKVVDDSGRACAPGEIGEIAIRGPNIMAGYWRQPEAAAEIIHDGWLRSGDLGRIDAGGYVYVVDRKKDLVISGGVNIYSREIEDLVAEHPDVAEVAVVGVPDAHWGESVVAVVVPRPGATIVPAAILEFCRRRIGGFKVPKRVEFLPELPKNASGKVLKMELRKSLGGGGTD